MAKRNIEPGKNRVNQYDDLTWRQEMFVKWYLVSLSSKKAAIAAGYSPTSAHIRGKELLKNPKIKEAIKKAQKKRGDKLEITCDMVLAELAKVGFSDIANYVEWGPRGFRLKDSSLTDTAAIKEVSETQSRGTKNTSLKLHDKLSALQLIGKHLGMFQGNAAESDESPLDVLAKAIERSARLLSGSPAEEPQPPVEDEDAELEDNDEEDEEDETEEED